MGDFGAKMSGVAKVRRALHESSSRYTKALGGAIYREGIEIVSDAVPRTPVDQGPLRAGAYAGPPVGPDPGVRRPPVCVSDFDGTTFPPGWTRNLARRLTAEFGEGVRVNDPFGGGHIIRSHAAEMPWVQIELSRSTEISFVEKGKKVLAALEAFCAEDLPQSSV